MNPNSLFSICNNLAMLGWIMLIVLPRWELTTKLITSCILPVLFGVIYLYLVAAYFGKAAGGFGSLQQVSQIFQNPHIMLAGWLHYLAFDLFVGSWEVRDARRLGIHHLLVIPCLLLTFMFGPIGLILYFILRWSIKRKLFVGGENVSA